MDPPLFNSENVTANEVEKSLKAQLQDTLHEFFFPKDYTENYLKNTAKDEEGQEEEEEQEDQEEQEEHLSVSDTSLVNILNKAKEKILKIQLTSNAISLQKTQYLGKKEQIDNSTQLRELLKLKHYEIINSLKPEFSTKYNLIRSMDIFPDWFKMYLDFQPYAEHPVCPACTKKETTKTMTSQKKEKKTVFQEGTETLIKKSTDNFKIIPSHVTFHNYIVGEVYQENVKIINTGQKIQGITIERFPKCPFFSIILGRNQKIAPGMSIGATVTFKPTIDISKTVEETIRFKNNAGEFNELCISASRDAPKLVSCIFHSSSTNLLGWDILKPKLEEKRKEPFQPFVDCGSCLVGQYVLVSLILENKGVTAKFFFITEDDWFYQNIDDVSSCMELFIGYFWIYPTFFEVQKGDTAKVNVIFQPTKAGVHTEVLHLMCDNNTFKEIEVVGDALEFSRDLIEIHVPPEVTEISSKQNYTLFLGHALSGSVKSLKIMVNNKSSICFTYDWKFKCHELKNVENLPKEWIIQNNFTPTLKPYSTTKFDFDIHIKAEKFGYHSVFFCFYVTRIPCTSLKENEEFTIAEKSDICTEKFSETVDILISQIEVCVHVYPNEDKSSCHCDEKEPQRKQQISFSEPFLNFGILPSGINIQKEFCINNYCDQNFEWQIWEVKYNIDSPTHMQIMKESENLSESFGTSKAGESFKLFYTITNECSQSYMSILVLISLTEELEGIIEDVCIVTYEIINFDIRIRSEKLEFPILYPTEIVYKGLTTELKLFVKNFSPITGYFRFLSPFGEDAEKLQIQLSPMSSVIKPLETITVTVLLICEETGFFENTFIPCFIGLGQRPTTVKVICAVDGPRVEYYLPINPDSWRRRIWPPILKYNYDLMICPRRESEHILNSHISESFDHVPDNTSIKLDTNWIKLSFTNANRNSISPYSYYERNSEPAEPMEYSQSIRESTSVLSDENLQHTLRKGFDGSLFLHEDVIEVCVPILSVSRVSVYKVNLSGISFKYRVLAKNFSTKLETGSSVSSVTSGSEYDLQRELKDSPYGIVIQPQFYQHETYNYTVLDFLIYANTFGIYIEEITVEIPDVPDYQFSMIIEIVGCPIQLPAALSAITEYPTIRFGSVPFSSPTIKRKIKIKNISAIPIQIIWYPFNNILNEKYIGEEQPFTILFDLFGDIGTEKLGEIVILDKYFGEYSEQFCKVEEKETFIDPKGEAFITVSISPTAIFQEQSDPINMMNYILGLLHIETSYMKCENYYYRKIDHNVNQVQIQVQTQLENPTFQLDVLDEKNDILFLYANDILLKNQYEHHKYVVLRNTSKVEFDVDLSVDHPFSFKSKKRFLDRTTVGLTRGSAKQVNIYCHLTPNEILDLSYLIYTDNKICISNKTVEKPQAELYTIDKENNTINLNKAITVRQGHSVKKFPMQLSILYPKISVKPVVVDYANVLLNQTNKNMITVFNHTGCIVKFAITKSKNANSFVITPHYGEIPASTGTLKQYVNIFIYFCAKQCKKYSASLRIVTNIPNYFIEVPLRGVGSINEKFANHVKI